MLCFLRSGAVGVLSGKPLHWRACFTHMYAKVNNRRSIKGDVSKEEVLLLHQTLVRELFYCENPQHRQNVTSRSPLVTQEMIQVEGFPLHWHWTTVCELDQVFLMHLPNKTWFCYLNGCFVAQINDCALNLTVICHCLVLPCHFWFNLFHARMWQRNPDHEQQFIYICL